MPPVKKSARVSKSKTTKKSSNEKKGVTKKNSSSSVKKKSGASSSVAKKTAAKTAKSAPKKVSTQSKSSSPTRSKTPSRSENELFNQELTELLLTKSDAANFPERLSELILNRLKCHSLNFWVSGGETKGEPESYYLTVVASSENKKPITDWSSGDIQKFQLNPNSAAEFSRAKYLKQPEEFPYHEITKNSLTEYKITESDNLFFYPLLTRNRTLRAFTTIRFTAENLETKDELAAILPLISRELQNLSYPTLYEIQQINHASELKDSKQAFRHDIEKLKSEHQSEIEEIKQSSRNELSELKSKSATELAEVKSKNKAELTEIKSKSEAELAEVKSKSEAELAEVKSKSEAELAELKSKSEAELAEVKSNSARQLEEIKSQSGVRVEEIQSKSADELKQSQEKWRFELENQKIKLQSEKERLISERDAALNELKEKYALLKSQAEGERADQKSRIEEQNSEINSYAKNLSSTEQKLAETQKSLEEYQESLKELQKKYSELSETERNNTRIYQQNIESERSRADSTIRELKEELSRLETEAAQTKKQFEQIESELKEKLTQREAKINDYSNNNSQLIEKIQLLQKELNQKGSESSNRLAEIKNLELELKKLSDERRTLKESYERDTRQWQENLKNNEDKFSSELRNSEISLNRLSEQLKKYEELNLQLQNELDATQNRNSKLSDSLTSEQQRNLELKNNNQAHQQQIAELKEKVASDEKRIDTLQNSLANFTSTNNQLKNEVGLFREREIQLKKAVSLLEQEKQGLLRAAQLHEDEIKELKASQDENFSNISDLNSRIDELQGREKKLQNDLNAALKREKGSNEAGQVITRLTKSLSESGILSDNLRLFTSTAFPSSKFKRIALYSCFDDNRIVFEKGYWDDVEINNENLPGINLRDTVFGETLATGKFHTLDAEESDLKDPDFPSNLLQAIRSSYFAELPDESEFQTFYFIPLRQLDQTIGLVTLAACEKMTLTEDAILLIDRLSPLLSIALKHEHNTRLLNRNLSQTLYVRELLNYLNLRLGQSIRLSNNFHKQLQANSSPEQPPTDSSKKLRIFNNFPGDEFRADELSASEFRNWMTNLAERAKHELGVNCEVTLEYEHLEQLKYLLDEQYSFLFLIATEAINNVIEHSQAKSLEIKSEQNSEFISIAITDDGEGLVRTTGSENAKFGEGLKAIQNMVGASGGQLELGRDSNGYGLSIKMKWRDSLLRGV